MIKIKIRTGTRTRTSGSVWEEEVGYWDSIASDSGELGAKVETDGFVVFS